MVGGLAESGQGWEKTVKLDNSLQQVWGSGLVLFLLGGGIYGVLQVLQVSVGDFTDWIIALASLWWLYVLVSLPWDLYFYARQLREDTRISGGKGIPIDPESRQYVDKLHRWSLRIALGLHGVTTLVFYGLAAFNLTPLGYLSAAAALLLTGVRPGICAYQYFISRLMAIQEEVFVPRADAIDLRQQLTSLTTQVEACLRQLDPHKQGSWAAKNQADQTYLRQELATQRALLEQLQAQNELEHQRILRENQQAISQLSVDSQFLSHVREILRFVKEA